MTAPLSHLTEAQALSADGLVELFELQLLGSSTRVYFINGPSVTWQGKIFQSLACKLTGESLSATEQKARPTLVVMNPAGAFNTFAFGGVFEGSTVVHRRALYQHVVQDVNLAATRYWRISRVFGVVSGQSISFELRSVADGPNFTIPARKYMPDDGFPFVTV
jgi:phage-related protein